MLIVTEILLSLVILWRIHQVIEKLSTIYGVLSVQILSVIFIFVRQYLRLTAYIYLYELSFRHFILILSHFSVFLNFFGRHFRF